MQIIEIPPVDNWQLPEQYYDQGDRRWLPCTERFYWDMLEILPPIQFYPALGLFGNMEAWKHNADGNPVHLFFVQDHTGRKHLCRCATPREIRAEFAEFLAPIDEENARKDREWRAKYAH